MMEYKPLGRTGLKVSQYVLGTMTFGQEADATESKKMFETARERGINLFDTANVYGNGRSEEILGNLTKNCRNDVIIATKSYFPMGQGPNDRGGSRFHLIKSVEDSLKRLKTDRIDLFYLHRIDEQADLEETLRAVEYLVQSGKILYPAVSNYSAWQMVKALGIAEKNHWSPICAVQPMYNIVKRQAEVEILPAAASENLAVFAYNPLAAGLLTGKYFSGAAEPSSRLNAAAMYHTRYMADESVESAKKFCQLAEQKNISPVQLAIAWVASHSAVTAPLLGARNDAQLRECLGALEIKMSDELRDEISQLSSTPPLATDRNEEMTSARYENLTGKK